MQRDEELFVSKYLGFPILAIYCLKIIELLRRKLQPAPGNAPIMGDPADGRFLALSSSPYSIDDPFQDTHVSDTSSLSVPADSQVQKDGQHRRSTELRLRRAAVSRGVRPSSVTFWGDFCPEVHNQVYALVH
jgi:hypothetical protein